MADLDRGALIDSGGQHRADPGPVDTEDREELGGMGGAEPCPMQCSRGVVVAVDVGGSQFRVRLGDLPDRGGEEHVATELHAGFRIRVVRIGGQHPFTDVGRGVDQNPLDRMLGRREQLQEPGEQPALVGVGSDDQRNPVSHTLSHRVKGIQRQKVVPVGRSEGRSPDHVLQAAPHHDVHCRDQIGCPGSLQRGRRIAPVEIEHVDEPLRNLCRHLLRGGHARRGAL